MQGTAQKRRRSGVSPRKKVFIFFCPVDGCGLSYSYKDNLKRHVKRKHTEMDVNKLMKMCKRVQKDGFSGGKIKGTEGGKQSCKGVGKVGKFGVGNGSEDDKLFGKDKCNETLNTGKQAKPEGGKSGNRKGLGMTKGKTVGRDKEIGVTNGTGIANSDRSSDKISQASEYLRTDSHGSCNGAVKKKAKDAKISQVDLKSKEREACMVTEQEKDVLLCRMDTICDTVHGVGIQSSVLVPELRFPAILAVPGDSEHATVNIAQALHMCNIIHEIFSKKRAHVSERRKFRFEGSSLTHPGVLADIDTDSTPVDALRAVHRTVEIPWKRVSRELKRQTCGRVSWSSSRCRLIWRMVAYGETPGKKARLHPHMNTSGRKSEKDGVEGLVVKNEQAKLENNKVTKGFQIQESDGYESPLEDIIRSAQEMGQVALFHCRARHKSLIRKGHSVIDEKPNKSDREAGSQHGEQEEPKVAQNQTTLPPPRVHFLSTWFDSFLNVDTAAGSSGTHGVLSELQGLTQEVSPAF